MMSNAIQRLALCAGLAAALSACATAGEGGSRTDVVATTEEDPPAQAGAPLLLLAMPPAADFQDVRRALITEVKKNFNVSTFLVTPSTAPADLAQAIVRTAPTCLVLMNNATVALYREYQETHRDQPLPPAVVVMTLFLEEVQASLKNTTGIAYEVPGVTAFVNLRSVIRAPIRRVGVVYRPAFRAFVERQKALAAREQIELVGAEVGKEVDGQGLRAALHTLLASDKVDALWLLNDNELIKNTQFLDETWRAEIAAAKVPLVVGVPNLVDPRTPLGSFAVVPDHEALGLQTANLIFELQDNGWRADEHGIELPLSVKTVVDLKQLRNNFGLQEDALHHIDRALEFAGEPTANAPPSVPTPEPPAPSAPSGDELSQLSLENLLSISTVTVSGNAESRATAAGNVIVITRQVMANNGWRSVADVLANVPGLYLVDDGSLTSVGIRGVTGGLRAGTRLIKIMINGVPVNFRPDVRAFIGPEYIPIDAIERIEVVKGPLSALYGAEAFLATVNVITRKPGPGTVNDFSGTAMSTNGAHAGYGASVATLYGGEWARLLLSATRYDIDRSGRSVQRTFAAQDPTNPRYAPFFSGPSTADRANPFGAFAQLALTSQRLGTLTIDAGLQRLDSMAEFQPVSALTHQSRESIQNIWSSATHEKSWTDRFNTRLTLGAAMGAPTRDDQLYLTQNFTQVYTPNYGYKSGTASFVANYTSGTLISARFGADAELQRQRILYYTSTFHDTQGTRRPGDRVDLVAPGVPIDETLSDLGLHGQLTVSPLEARPNLLQLSLNGRIDRVDYGTFNPGLQPSWRVAVVDRWTPSIVTKLIYGRAFQAPSGVLMFAQPAFPTNNVIGSLTAGAASPLKPQTVDSVEGVAYVLLGDRLSIDLAGFYQRIADRIEFQFAGSDYIAHNAGVVSYLGAEASLKASIDFITPFADASFVRSLTNGSDGNPLTAYPALMGSVGFDAEPPRLPVHLNVRARLVGPRAATFANTLFNGLQGQYSVPGYVSVDATLSSGGFHLLGPQTLTRFSVTGRNILDHRYSEPGFGGFDVPIQGRTVMFGVQQQL
jgi:iron complex outermembrane receptor protein